MTSQATTDLSDLKLSSINYLDVAGTDANGIDTQNVKILLSVDGGKTFVLCFS